MDVTFDNITYTVSSGKRDIFGFKFGGGSSVNAGFGDAANEDASANEDDLVRRRRALDVLGATYAYVSLLPQSPHGTNVNIVKVSSVSNVNNFGEMPAAETATTVAAPVAERRRKRSPDMVQLAAFEKKSLSVDSVIGPDKKLTTHERLESVRGGSRTLLREDVARNKRSPQSDGQEEGQDGGPPKGPPPRGGPKGPRGRGPPPGCPPPGGEEETTATTATVERRKREVVELVETERDKRSPKGGRGGASCRGGGGGGGSQGTPPPNAEVRRKRDTSNESSDYSTSDESDEAAEQNSGRSLAAHRNRRQALGGGEMSGKVGSWFEQLAGVFVDTVKKVVNVTKKTFEKKTVLNGVSGRFQSGELTAIMGPSGAGKSSLLNILTGYTTHGVKGTLAFGSSGSTNRKLCSYILQEDYLQPLFTVHEIMLMACDLKVSSDSLNRSEKLRLVDKILDTLHLSYCKQTRCGSLSGGQRKRLSIALELIDNPPILFLDEPTTGLDSSSSLYTIKLLQGLAREGRTIVCTIHQPSATVYEMFDHVYVLAEGHCVYQGSALNTVPYLRSVGLHCPAYHNAADYLLEVTNKEYGNFTKALAKAATDPSWRLAPLVDRLGGGGGGGGVPAALPPCPPAYDSNHNDAVYQGHRKEVAVVVPLVGPVDQLPGKMADQSQRRPSEFAKLLILMKRSNIQLYRDWTVTHLKLFVHIVCAIVIGLLFGDSGINATKSISNVASFMVHILYLWYTTVMPGVLKYPYEMNILKKESFNRWYKIRTYFVASMLTSLPVQIFFAIVYATIVYAMTYQPCELERYLMFTAVLVLNTIVADGFGLFLGTFLNEINGTFIGAIMTCFMFVFCGFLIMFSHMSDAMRGISYLSSHRYSFEALVLTAYDDSRSDLVCPKDEMYCHYVKANTIMRELGVVSGNYLFNVVTLVVHFVAIKVVGFWTLKRKLKMG